MIAFLFQQSQQHGAGFDGRTLITILTGGVAARQLSAAVRALEPPDAQSGKLYRWFYRYTQIAMANPDLADKAADLTKKAPPS